MKLNCYVDLIYEACKDSTSLQNWCVTDSSGVENHIFKYFIDSDKIHTYYPQVKISNEKNSINFVNDRQFEWNTSIYLEFTDIPNRYEFDSLSELIYKFQGFIDDIFQDIVCSNSVKDKGFSGVEMVHGPNLASYEVKNQDDGRILQSGYVFGFWG